MYSTQKTGIFKKSSRTRVPLAGFVMMDPWMLFSIRNVFMVGTLSFLSLGKQYSMLH